MATAKDIIVKPISGPDAAKATRLLHYSGKHFNMSKIHFGVFLSGKCCGVMSFGPPMDKKRLLPLVRNTGWSQMLELNRMAFSDALPRNSESRALGVAIRTIRKKYPFIKFIVSFSDATQCGDGTIYRASGFLLTQIKKNNSMLKLPSGEVICKLVVSALPSSRRKYGYNTTDTMSSWMTRIGAKVLDGFQLRYIKILDGSPKCDWNFNVLPFSDIEKLGAGMYRGKKRAVSKDIVASDDQLEEGGATPTTALQETSAEQIEEAHL